MRAPIMTAAAVAVALALTACSPAFNWRETVIEATQLSAMFPCKPEKAARKVALGGATVELTMHHSTQSAWAMERSSVLPQALVVEAAGTSSDGRPLVLKAAWFARGAEVYAALLYGPALSPEVAEVFFSGLRFR